MSGIINKQTNVGWNACASCGQRVTGDSIHTCPPQLRELTDEEITQVCSQIEPFDDTTIEQAFIEFARAILRKAQEK